MLAPGINGEWWVILSLSGQKETTVTRPLLLGWSVERKAMVCSTNLPHPFD